MAKQTQPESRSPEPRPSEPKGNRPVDEIRYHNLRAAIWRNETKNGPMYTVTATRSYREGEEWRDSTSFGFEDLMTVAKLFMDVHTRVAGFIDEDRAAAAGASKSSGR